MSDEPMANEAGATTRRAVFAGAGALGAAAVLAACGTDQGTDPYTGAPVDGGADTPGGSAGTQSEAPAEQGQEPEGQVQGLITTEEVEVGGGVIREEEDVVITQPVAGEWRGFSATCTHQGCPVTEVSDGTINCNCHGSKFSIEDGSVVTGPATQPLETRTVSVEEGWVVLT